MTRRDDDGLLSPYRPTILPLQGAAKDGKPRASSGKWRQYATAIILNVAALAAGSVMGWPSPAGPILMSNATSPMDSDGDGIREEVSPEHFSWLASVNFLGGAVGAMLFGALADRLGRRVAGLVLAVPYALGWVLVATTESLLPLYAARLLGGLSAGGTMVVSPLYVAETAEDEHRGALGTFLAVGINSGILFTFTVSAFADYRVLPLVCLLLPAVFFLCLLRLPETPVYLVKRGRAAAARRSLAWYRGGGDVDAELEAMLSAAKREESSTDTDTASLADLFRHRGTRRALVQSLLLLANQQFCGVIAVLNFTEIIFTAAGSSMSSTTAAIVVAALQAVFTYLSSFLIDRAGRRPLIIVSNLVMAACLIILGGFFFAKEQALDVTAVGWLPVLAMSLYVIAFAMGVGPVPLVLLAETYATRVRSLATGVGLAVQTVSAFACTKFFVNVNFVLGMHGSLWLFAAFCLAGAAYTALAVLETKGKALEDILAEFHGAPVVLQPAEEAGLDAGDDDDAVFRDDAVEAVPRHQETKA